ncbi:MAG: hypothetical protein G01um101438_580 [Parcubacteria group bacterium Gr01-1014_38]|nr:MAG: hypothetical protein G01um101438_580 [Parcubacteria group bacterium Gr01-1014_38]
MRNTLQWFGGAAVLLIAGIVLHALILVDDLPDLTHDVADDPENFVEVWGTRTLGQTIRPPLPSMSGIALSLHRRPGVHLSGYIILHIRESPDATNDLRIVRLPVVFVRGDRFTEFPFPPLNTRSREALYLFIEYPDGTNDRPLLLRAEQREVDRSKIERIVDYAGGTLIRDHRAAAGDLAFQLLKRARRPFGLQVIGAALLGGISLLIGGMLSIAARRQWVKTSWIVPAVLLVLGAGLPLIFYLPLLLQPSFLGVGDWDMNTTLHAAAERALLREQTFPGWNPYLCGGTPLAAFPEAPVFSPFFTTVLLGGPVIGFKMNVLLHGALGFLGMLLWLRKGWNLSWLAAFVGAAVVVFSSFMGLHLAAGHSRKVAAAWIPWILLFFQRACASENPPTGAREQHRAHRWRSLRFAAPAGGFLALMLLDGSVYLSIYSATFVVLVGILASLNERRVLPIAASLVTVLLGGLLAGVHLVPTAYSQATLQTVLTNETAPVPLQALWHVFLDPNQRDDAQKFAGQTQPWLEYGAYVGVVPALLSVLGIFTAWRAVRPWAGASLFFLLVLVSSSVQRGIEAVPILGDLRNPQRMAGMVTIAIGLTAALGTERVMRWLLGTDRAGSLSSSPPSLHRAVGAALGVLTTITIGHLIFVNTETLAGTFVVPPPPAQEEPFRQGWARNRLVGIEDSFVFTMENTLRNRGSINRCSVAGIRPTGALRMPPPRDPGGEVAAEFQDAPYRGEAFLLEGQGTAAVEEQTTNRVRVRYQTSSPALLALNQNYHPGWRTSRRSTEQDRPREEPATFVQGLVATVLPPGSGTVTFSYTTPALRAGMLTTAFGMLAALWLWHRSTLPRTRRAEGRDPSAHR